MVEEDIGRLGTTPPEYNPLKPHPLGLAHVHVVVAIDDIVRKLCTFDDYVIGTIRGPTKCDVVCSEQSKTTCEVVDSGGEEEDDVGERRIGAYGAGSVARLVAQGSTESLAWRTI